MARKGKKKKKNNQRAKTKYNKTEFIDVFCQTCMICDMDDPKLCYGMLYKKNPKTFINKVFNNLIDINVIYQSMNQWIGTMSIEQFENTICRTGICFNGDQYASAMCKLQSDCYKAFKNQMGMESPALLHEADASNLIYFDNKTKRANAKSFKKKKKKKKKIRYVPTAYPTFFFRKDPEFEKFVRRIMYGDNDQQQDTNKELSAGNTGTSD
jgi:hypothetical protein